VPRSKLVRDAKKGEAWKAKGAEVAVADVKDVKAMTQALRGASGAYLLNPPDMSVTDIEKWGKESGAAFKAAITESGIPHVVFLSSIGAQQATGTGPVVSLHHIEHALSGLKTHVTFLRAGYFMENTLANLHPMKEQGVLPAMLGAQFKIEMVATADIGAIAAELLRAGVSAPKVVELSGPVARTLTEVGQAFSTVLKKPINLAPVPPPAQEGVLVSVGLPPTWAKAYADMNAAMESRKMVFEGTPRRGLIPFEAFVARALS
jgi:uncharacterized protein YbjT (DUF2867 family)